MIERKISLDRLSEIEKFIGLAEEHSCNIKVVYRQCTVDGRALMGLVSLAVYQPLKVIAEGEDAFDFAYKLDCSFCK
ncbi:MAG TPA: HPr family phosphocarrier protein [Bacillota bacterium]|nr:HPr family phosphocarrier protein [Bacillota bacterium]